MYLFTTFGALTPSATPLPLHLCSRLPAYLPGRQEPPTCAFSARQEPATTGAEGGTTRWERCAGAALCCATFTTAFTTSAVFSARKPCFAATPSTEGSGAAAACHSAAALGMEPVRCEREEKEEFLRSELPPTLPLLGLPPAESVGDVLLAGARRGAGASTLLLPPLPAVPDREREDPELAMDAAR